MKKIKVKAWAFGFILVLIAGCQNLTHQDAQKSIKRSHSTRHAVADAPPLSKIPAFFKTLHPRSKPLSRYGNPLTYRVAGHQYAVMKSANGFKQRGLASWYGSKFHHRRTSSGEPYDMHALTAAHKTLPLSTYIRVKNLDNGRVAIVKVNDRGPFHPGRIVDLSYRAATQLGVLPKGIAHVQIEAIPTFSPPPQSTTVGKYYIQVASFLKHSSAQQFKRMILTYSLRPVFIVHQDKKFQVRIGPFPDKRQLNNAEAQLLKRGIKGGFTILI